MRLLHLEDSAADAKLVLAALKGAGLDFEIRRVETEVAFTEALTAYRPDLILADYQLPSFDGAQALKIARKLVPETPFIFVTGALGEEIAIETLKAGATDYVLKQRISRLTPAVSRAMAEAAERRERKKAENEVERLNRDLRQRVNELQTLFEVAPVAIAVALDPKCENIRVNRVGAAFLGIDPATNASKTGPNGEALPYKVLKNGKELPPDQLPMQLAAATGRSVQNEEFDVVTDTGNVITLLQYASPLHDDQGAIRGCLGVWVDITAYKKSEAALIAARKEAERLSRVKDEFLAVLSHELRTPLTPILGWARMMRSGQLSQDFIKRGIEVIERNIVGQVALIEDLLDISRITSGKLAINLQPTELAPVIDSAIEAVQPLKTAKTINFNVSVVPARVQGDPSRLRQVVVNLLSNAVKFTPPGGSVNVSTARLPAGNLIEITVSDSGEGISPQYLPFIFDMFSQADSTTTRTHGGLGLGLSIVKRLVEEHGGTIRAESAGKGLGAVFKVTLPMAVSPNIEQPQQPSPADVSSSGKPLIGHRILVVEDDQDTLELIKFVLEERGGATVRSASSVVGAIDLLSQQRFSLIVADIGMPEQDGYVLSRKVRENDANTPMVALTALARGEDRARILAEGFKFHLAKPVDPAELISIVSTFAKLLPD